MNTTNVEKLETFKDVMRDEAEERHVQVYSTREELIAAGLIKPAPDAESNHP